MASQEQQLLKGFRDFGPDKMPARLVMFEKIRQAFERFGFQPMETPAIELASVLSGKYGAEEKLMYKFTDNGGRDVAMRYDLTVPLARFYAANKSDLPRPFKRYAIGPVWRAENTQKGRYREFYQCDVDVVGSGNALADAESIAAVAAALADLGIKDIIIRVNNRKILDGLLEKLGVAASQFIPIIRVLDKLDKIGEKAVASSLTELGLTGDQVKNLFQFLNVRIANSKDLDKAFSRSLLESQKLTEGVAELSAVLDRLATMETPAVKPDLKLARGLDYYTGTVCEIVLTKFPEYGSVAGGGRYDNLISGITGGITGEKTVIPAVGMSIGIDRLIAAMQELKLEGAADSGEVIVLNLDDKLLPTYIAVVAELRKCGINTELYYTAESMDKQFKFAEKKKIKLGVIIGDEEIKSGTVKIKNLMTRKQVTVKAEKLASEILGLL